MGRIYWSLTPIKESIWAPYYISREYIFLQKSNNKRNWVTCIHLSLIKDKQTNKNLSIFGSDITSSPDSDCCHFQRML